jgi:hypothetical protein
MATVTATATATASPASTTGAGARRSLDHQDVPAISPGTLRRLPAAGPAAARGAPGWSSG